MSSDTRLTNRCTIAVRVFLVVLNLKVLLLSLEISRCLRNTGVLSGTVKHLISELLTTLDHLSVINTILQWKEKLHKDRTQTSMLHNQ